MKVLILFLLFCLTLEERELYQYSFINIYGSEDFYLKLNGFKSGDTVYIEVTYYDTWSSYSPSINYLLTNSFSDFLKSNLFSSLSWSSSSSSNSKRTRYYKIKMNGNYNYLLFKFSGSYTTWYTVKHTKSSPTWIIVGAVSSFVIIACIVIIICWCRRRSMPDYAPRVDGPLISPYPVVQPQPQPVVYTQPTYHPYV